MHSFLKDSWDLGFWQAIAVAITLLSGCTTVGPEYTRPGIQVLDRWMQADDNRVRTDPADARRWWAAFQDPVLERLVRLAWAQNLPLRVAGARVFEARARLGIAVGEQYPQVQQVAGSAAYNRESERAPSAPQRYAPPAPPRAQAHQPPQAHPQAQAQQSRGRGAGPERQRDRRDRDTGMNIEAELQITLEDVLRGAESPVRLRHAVACESCNGRGTKHGSTLITCAACNDFCPTGANRPDAKHGFVRRVDPDVCIGSLYFETADGYEKGIAASGGALRGDIPNFTDLSPVRQISEVLPV